jgi:hypothetical protein
MKIFRYKSFIKESKEDIESICKKYGIKNYTINEDGTIDVDGDVYLYNKALNRLPLKFGKVSGYFDCSDNKLTSLEGSPREVGFDFYCDKNKLESLEGISKYISGLINCEANKLIDAKGVKDGWRGEVWIEGNPVYEIFRLFPQERFDEVIEYLNEYEVIRDGKVVVLQALELVFHEMGLEVPEIDQIKGYDIQY